MCRNCGFIAICAGNFRFWLPIQPVMKSLVGRAPVGKLHAKGVRRHRDVIQKSTALLLALTVVALLI